MPEIDVTIPSGNIRLEGRVDEAPGGDWVVLCHPHPQYGGNMDNNVVWSLKKVLRGWGWQTLRYNSRGVGESSGVYGGGEGETEDLLAVVQFALEQGGGLRIHLAGYSYGAWIGLKAIARGFETDSIILVSPPIDFIGFDGLSIPEVPCLITLGTKDSFCSTKSLDDWVKGLNPSTSLTMVDLIPGCDHFHWGWESTLASKIEAFLQRHFGKR